MNNPSQSSGNAGRIAEIRRELAELRASLPAHSLKPSMLARLEELQEELDKLLAQPSEAA